MYDDGWHIVGTFRDQDTSAKERFIYHNASDADKLQSTADSLDLLLMFCQPATPLTSPDTLFHATNDLPAVSEPHGAVLLRERGEGGVAAWG